jgi:hypothetical protein
LKRNLPFEKISPSFGAANIQELGIARAIGLSLRCTREWNSS